MSAINTLSHIGLKMISQKNIIDLKTTYNKLTNTEKKYLDQQFQPSEVKTVQLFEPIYTKLNFEQI